MQKLFYSIQLITPHHLQQVYDVGIRQAQRKMREMRDHFQKSRKQPITLAEFRSFTGFSLEAICGKLGWPFDPTLNQ